MIVTNSDYSRQGLLDYHTRSMHPDQRPSPIEHGVSVYTCHFASPPKRPDYLRDHSGAHFVVDEVSLTWSRVTTSVC